MKQKEKELFEIDVNLFPRTNVMTFAVSKVSMEIWKKDHQPWRNMVLKQVKWGVTKRTTIKMAL